jgi:DNA topoisomerase-3
MSKTLYITEKPSQVGALRDALKARNMYNNVEIEPLAGHIVRGYKFEEYDSSFEKSSWIEDVRNKKIPFYPKELKKKVKEKASFMREGKKMWSDYQAKFDNVAEKIKECEKIVLATDPDNEGAGLGLEVIEMCGALNKVKGMINMSKLDIESLKKEVDILDKIPYMKMYEACDARTYYDQVFGINLTIIATSYLGNGNLLQMGGVKLPVLLMVVMRDIENETFKNIPFFNVVGKAVYQGKEFDIEVINDKDDSKSKNRFDKESDAFEIIEKIKASNGFDVIDFGESNKSESPPKPYSLTNLQSECNKKFKMNAKETLKHAQSLYDMKLQSYPRTDSNYYSEGEYSFVSGILSTLKEVDGFKKFISKIETIDSPKKRNIFDDSKVDAHTALSPTTGFDIDKYNKLSDISRGVFDLVALRYIIQFMEDYKYLNISGIGRNRDISIKFGENICTSLGWKESLDKSDDINTIRTIPSINKGDKISILSESLYIKKGTTKPKPKFTEATLLEAMENVSRFFDDEIIKQQLGEKGIGTPATRAGILDELKTAKKGDEPYLKLVKNNIISTSKARNLIKLIPTDISSPILRADMESRLKEIIKGNLSKEEFYIECKKLVDGISTKISSIGKLPEFVQKQESIKTNLKCPLCQSAIIDETNVFKCENNKFENGKQSGCKFIFFKNQKLIDAKFALKQFDRVLKGETLIGRNGNKISLDLSNDFFTKIEFVSNANSTELIETEKTFRKGEKFCFKNCFGKNLTKNQAEKLLDGGEVVLKRKSKSDKEYNVTVWIEADGKFGSSFD